jgi:hypothetical protein
MLPSRERKRKIMIEQKTTMTDTEIVLDQIREAEATTKSAIASLLKQREELEKSTEATLKKIASDLKALGYTKPRAPKGSKKQAAAK